VKVKWCGSTKTHIYEGMKYEGEGWFYGVHVVEGEGNCKCPICGLELGEDLTLEGVQRET
jgi:hypothetical protein